MGDILNLDKWQEEVLATKGNICLRSGRQVGKSTIIGLKAAKFALENPNKLIMIISKTERQAGLLFAKVLRNVVEIDKFQIKKGKDRPTKHLINLKNGSCIHSLPAGDTGFGIMGFTIDLLIADEAAFIPEEVWNSIIPALAITRGEIWLLSTPFVKEGYYYQCFSNKAFTAFHTSSEDCPRKDQDFLDDKKKNLTKAQYAQMYLGQFVDEIRQLFPDDLIKTLSSLKRRVYTFPDKEYYIGCDVARMDRDEFTFEVFEKIGNRIEQVESIVTKGVPLTESARRIIQLNTKYNFRKIYVDSGGMGIAICDILRENDSCKRKVVEINNASRSIDTDDRRKKILKEDLYMNLLKLMQHKQIKFLDDDEIKASLKGIQAENDEKTKKLHISGNDDHIVEGIVRGVWCMHEKNLNPIIV